MPLIILTWNSIYVKNVRLNVKYTNDGTRITLDDDFVGITLNSNEMKGKPKSKIFLQLLNGYLKFTVPLLNIHTTYNDH